MLKDPLRWPWTCGERGRYADQPRLVQGAMKQVWLFVPNPRDLCEKDVVAIYEAAFREE